jgi:hypothetical protein
MYKLLPNDLLTGQPNTAIQRLSDGAFIPMNPDNTDYQQYLKWVEEGNSPLPADVAASPSTPLPADEGAA